MTISAFKTRHGITLLEVLIAIGILAVGLTSVVALVPAGHSNAGQAVSYDRANTLAHNALADAVTFGLLKLSTLGIASGTTSSRLIVDTQPTAAVLGGVSAFPRALGIYSSGTESAISNEVMQLLTQGRDDLLTMPQADEDSPPIYRPIDGALGFEGKFSCLYALSPIPMVGSMSAGQQARLSVVLFHNRSSGADLVVTGTWQPDYSLAFTPPSDRSLNDCLRAGSVFYNNGRFYQARSVTFDGSGRAHVMLSGTTMFSAGTAVILLDSVGLAERVVTLEGSGPFSQ